MLTDLPFIRISKRALYERFKKIEHFGILKLKCDKNKDGTFTYVGLGDDYISLISTSKAHSVNAQQGCQSAESAVVSQLNTKNSKLYNRELNNIKKNSKKKVPEAKKLEW